MTPASPSGRPTLEQHDPYYLKYLDLVPEEDILPLLSGQQEELQATLAHFPGEASLHRYAPGKWSVREVLGHLVDTERVIGVKLLYTLRGDPTRLVWHDQDLWNEHAGFDQLETQELLSEFAELRAANLTLLRRLTPQQWEAPRLPGAEFAPRALAYLLAGHIRYHLAIVAERYRPSP